MRRVLFIITLFCSSIAFGSEVANTLLEKAAETAEEKAELAVNDIFENVEVDLSGFYKGKPSYGISTILPLYDQNNRNTFDSAEDGEELDFE